MKRCTRCKKTKPLNDYYKDRSREDGHAHRCKECQRAVMHTVRGRREPRPELRTQHVDPSVVEKRCPRCKQTKKLNQFHRDGSNPYRSYVVLCKACVSERYYKRKHQLRKEYIQKTYGLTSAAFEMLKEKAGHRCEICRMPFTETRRGAAIDHCHRTGKTRGVLCINCNLGLGQFKDDIQLLVSAVDYLERVG